MFDILEVSELWKKNSVLEYVNNTGGATLLL